MLSPKSNVIEDNSCSIQGIISQVEYIRLGTKNNNLRITIPPRPHGEIHEILRVTLLSGEIFAVDISGAQYGYYDSVIPWAEYEQRRVSQIVHVGPAPESHQHIEVNDYSSAKIGSVLLKLHQPKEKGRGTYKDHMEVINLKILEWQSGEKLSLQALWKLPEA